jgi:N,N'-diacetylchitobiose transport system permease protein
MSAATPVSTSVIRTADQRPAQVAKRRRRAMPYVLLIPAVGFLVLALGYPLVRQVVMSFQEYGLAQQFGQPAEWVGVDNFSRLLGDGYFWLVVARSIAFCLVNAGLTMVGGIALAMLMTRISTPVRLVLQVALLLAWAMPHLASLTVWQWLFDTDFGVVNYALTSWFGLDFKNHAWLIQPLSFYFVATVIICWMSVPFVVFAVYAALTQVPGDLLEAGEIDGPAHRRPAADHLGSQGLHPDLRLAGRGRGHSRDPPDRHVCLPTRNQGGELRPRGGGLRDHPAADRGRRLLLRPAVGATGGPTVTTIVQPQPQQPPTAAAEGGKTSGPRRSRRYPVRPAGRATANVVALVAAVGWVFPVYWMLNSSLLPQRDVRSREPSFLPVDGSLDSYRRVFETDFVNSLRLSATVTVLTVVLTLAAAFLAALAVTRFRFGGRRGFILAVLIVQMVPVEALFISQFKMLEGWQLLNTVTGLTLLYVGVVVPFTIWMLRGFVNGVPIELEEAAMIDGCSRFKAFVKVTLPLLAPGLVASGIYAFILAWNEFVVALVIMNRPETQTLPVWLRTFIQANRASDWGAVMAGATLLAIPVVIFFLFVQHRMTSGLVAGAVKG